MPQWLARLVPWMDDRGSDAAWPDMVRRFAGIASRWHSLDSDAWERARRASIVDILREALSHVTIDKWGVTDAINGVISWVERGEPKEEQKHVRSAAAAAYANADAAAAAYAAYAAYAAAAYAAAYAAYAAAAYAAAVRRAAVDRMTTAILDAIEAEIALAVAS